jgi:anti-sigma B factor antagonist
VSVQRWPVQWTGSRAIVTFPADIDVTNASRIREQLIALVEDEGARVVVADLTATSFCDSAGITALATAHRKAKSSGAVVQVIAVSPQVRRVFELTGLNQVLEVFPSLDETQAG